ncbi:MAG: hypothetical protein Q7T57_01195 [Dehalococcoidales bacterium]|nr:hypothetical protein [Dehalococcoidales bacterium]
MPPAIQVIPTDFAHYYSDGSGSVKEGTLEQHTHGQKETWRDFLPPLARDPAIIERERFTSTDHTLAGWLAGWLAG